MGAERTRRIRALALVALLPLALALASCGERAGAGPAWTIDGHLVAGDTDIWLVDATPVAIGAATITGGRPDLGAAIHAEGRRGAGGVLEAERITVGPVDPAAGGGGAAPPPPGGAPPPPPRRNANTRMATQVAHSATLNAAKAAASLRRSRLSATPANTVAIRLRICLPVASLAAPTSEPVRLVRRGLVAQRYTYRSFGRFQR
jgi:hypothetical protein